MLIQVASLVAVHVHSRAAATGIFTWPPPAATVGADAGNSVAQRTVLGPVISVTEVPPHATERESAVTKSPNRQVSRRCTARADASQVPPLRPSGTPLGAGGSSCSALLLLSTSAYGLLPSVLSAKGLEETRDVMAQSAHAAVGEPRAQRPIQTAGPATRPHATRVPPASGKRRSRRPRVWRRWREWSRSPA
jgi:hypothetical protein